MDVIGSVFHGPGQDGDFGWMRQQAAYARALFVFNDNETQFRAYQRDRTGGAGCAPGGGNAAIRPWRCQDPPRAAGIPTGDHSGYPHLSEHAKAVIDDAIALIRDLLATGKYDRVVYSAADAGGALGTSIFSPGDDVKAYIVEQLRALASP